MKLELEVPEPPEGWEYTGEFKKLTRGEHGLWDVDGERLVWTDAVPSRDHYMILRKKQTYTEAVKATGWKWPASESYPEFVRDRDGTPNFYEKVTETCEVSGMHYGRDPLPASLFAPHLLPPRFPDRFDWTEILRREDFV